MWVKKVFNFVLGRSSVPRGALAKENFMDEIVGETGGTKIRRNDIEQFGEFVKAEMSLMPSERLVRTKKRIFTALLDVD